EVNGNQQALPKVVVQHKVVQPVYIARNAAIVLTRIAAEQNRTRVAGAGDAALIKFEQVLMVRSERSGAQLAQLRPVVRLADEALQGRKCIGSSVVAGRSHLRTYAGGRCGMRGSIGARSSALIPVASREVRPGPSRPGSLLPS